MTRAIAGKDLRVLWASPIPYVVGALFHVVLGILFIDQLQSRGQALSQPLFPIAGFLLLAVVPLVAMRSMAEEARTGTLDLLQAAPVRSGPLVAGKWLAAVATVLGVLAPALLFVVLLVWFGNPDAGPILAGFLGLALLAAALTAVGVLASSLTSSLPVAAMIAFFTSLLLWFVHSGAGPSAAGGLLDALSLSARLRAFSAGVIDSGDVAFFLALTVGSLVVAAAAVDARRLR